MGKLAQIRRESRWGDIIEGQPQHLAIMVLMVLGAMSLLRVPENAPRVLGLTGYGWAVFSIWAAVVHQLVVAVGFRLQLHRNLLSRVFGARDMQVWAAIFMPLLLARPVTLCLIGLADTVPITGFRLGEVAIGLGLLALAVWAMHSVLVHFTLPRALGGDHFRESYAAMAMVRSGVFKYTSNAMYGVVFLGFWGIALVFGSWNAIVVALFQHGYIWVHMYCTEAPDMRRIYQSDT
jgi:protein-S-isoprenylcysteine O-methyltransferase Ste14